MTAERGCATKALATMGLAFSLLAATAGQAAPVDAAGTFVQDDHSHAVQLHLDAPGTLSAQTRSFASGGFATVLSLFGPGTLDPALLQLDVGSLHTCGPGSGSPDPSTGFCWDAALEVQLGAGDYTLVLTQDGNQPLGPLLSHGFQQDGQPGFSGQQYLGDDSRRFIHIDGSPRGANWALQWELTPDDERQLPEPGTAFMLPFALGALAAARRRRRRLVPALALAGGLMAGPAQALDAPLTADTHLSSTLPTNNFGSLPNLNVGGGAQALLRFDLSTLPDGTTAAKVVKATLKFHVNRVGTPGALEVLAVNANWDETTVTATAPPPNAGAGSGRTVTVNRAGQFHTVDLTSLVKQWVTNPGSNFGVVLQPALSALGTVAFIDSKENVSTAHVAQLDVTLADQGPPGRQGCDRRDRCHWRDRRNGRHRGDRRDRGDGGHRRQGSHGCDGCDRTPRSCRPDECAVRAQHLRPQRQHPRLTLRQLPGRDGRGERGLWPPRLQHRSRRHRRQLLGAQPCVTVGTVALSAQEHERLDTRGRSLGRLHARQQRHRSLMPRTGQVWRCVLRQDPRGACDGFTTGPRLPADGQQLSVAKVDTRSPRIP